MGMIKRLVLGLVVAEVAYLVWQCMKEEPLPYIDPNPWWGPGQPGKEDTSIRQFKIDIPKAVSEGFPARSSAFLPKWLIRGLVPASFLLGLI